MSRATAIPPVASLSRRPDRQTEFLPEFWTQPATKQELAKIFAIQKRKVFFFVRFHPGLFREAIDRNKTEMGIASVPQGAFDFRPIHLAILVALDLDAPQIAAQFT